MNHVTHALDCTAYVRPRLTQIKLESPLAECTTYSVFSNLLTKVIISDNFV